MRHSSIGPEIVSLGEYTTTRDPPPGRGARRARAQRGRSGALCQAAPRAARQGRGEWRNTTRDPPPGPAGSERSPGGAAPPPGPLPTWRNLWGEGGGGQCSSIVVHQRLGALGGDAEVVEHDLHFADRSLYWPPRAMDHWAGCVRAAWILSWKSRVLPKNPTKNHSSQKCNSDFLCKGDFGRQESNSPHLREFRALIPGSEGNTAWGLIVTLVSSQTSPRLLTQSWINPEARCHSWHSCGSVWCVCVCARARARVGACSRV